LKRLLFIVLAIGLLSAGCLKNPFATRDSELPAGTSGTWETPATPEVVLINLLFAYNEKNIQNFQLCLSDQFVFSAPEDSIEAEAQGNGYLFHDWFKDVELATTQNIFSTFSESGRYLDLILSSSTDYPDSLGDTLAVIYRNYILRVVESDSLGVDTTLIEGLAGFGLSQTQFNWWSIDFWQELPSTRSELDWGDFKAEYRNR